ncbi:MAG: PRC-barrel domain-containing protein [Thermodesulfobacteriota bacterium]
MNTAKVILAWLVMSLFVVGSAYAGGMEHKATMSGGGSGFHRAAKIVGMSALDSQGQYLGRIDDLVFGEDGQIQYVVVARGEVLGMGGKLVPVPWSAASFHPDKEGMVNFNVSRDRLNSAPSFSKGEWDNFASSEFKEQIHAYYGGETKGMGMKPERSGPGSYGY